MRPPMRPVVDIVRLPHNPDLPLPEKRLGLDL